MRCSQVVTADVAPEPVGRPVGRDQRVLYGVGRLLAVAQGTQGDRPQPVAVPADELAEGVPVAGDVGAQQSRVVAVGVGPVTARPYRSATPYAARRRGRRTGRQGARTVISLTVSVNLPVACPAAAW